MEVILNDMTHKVFETFQYGMIALKHFGDVPENFRIYDAGFEPQPPKLWNGIRVTGAQFEVESEGLNKGKLCKIIPGTIRKCTVTRKEIEEFDLQNSN